MLYLIQEETKTHKKSTVSKENIPKIFFNVFRLSFFNLMAQTFCWQSDFDDKSKKTKFTFEKNKKKQKNIMFFFAKGHCS